MNFTNFDKSNIKSARSAIDAKLAELKELGLDIQLGNIKFFNDHFTTRVTCNIVGAPGTMPISADDLYAKEFKHSYDSMKYPTALGKSVLFNGQKFKFCGFKPRARVRHAIIEDSAGKKWRCNFDSISAQLV